MKIEPGQVWDYEGSFLIVLDIYEDDKWKCVEISSDFEIWDVEWYSKELVESCKYLGYLNSLSGEAGDKEFNVFKNWEKNLTKGIS